MFCFSCIFVINNESSRRLTISQLTPCVLSPQINGMSVILRNVRRQAHYKKTDGTKNRLLFCFLYSFFLSFFLRWLCAKGNPL